MILDKKHEMQRKLFRQFAETEFTKEIQDELDNTGEFNWDMHKKMAKYGFMGVKIPKQYGGLIDSFQQKMAGSSGFSVLPYILFVFFTR